MSWTISFYSDTVAKEAQSLPAGIKASLLRTLDLIREFGIEWLENVTPHREA
jgi:hypothetical protein